MRKPNSRIPTQRKTWACGPAVVRGILRCFGREFDDDGKSITEALLIPRCRTTEERGTSHHGVVRALKSFGFSVETPKKNVWQRPDRCWKRLVRAVREEKIPVIVNYFPAGDGHYVLIVGMWERSGKRWIKIADPRYWFIKMRTSVVAWDDFVRAWIDYKEPDYPRSPKSFVARWWAIARLEPLKND